MILLYWWMHWFWITLKIILVVSEEPSLHSSETNATAMPPRLPKQLEISTSNPANNTIFSNNTIKNSPITKYQKPSLKKYNVTMNKHFFNKEVTVITQKSTVAESLLINSSIRAITEETPVYTNDTNFNQSFVLTSKKLMEEDDVSENLSAAGITGITLGCVVIVGIICGVSYFFYRNRGFNKPQVLNDRCSNPDSSGYIDDASIRDNSEEMYSLDNDSFLNSLEAMTIQNYWTDTVKHTKL